MGLAAPLALWPASAGAAPVRGGGSAEAKDADAKGLSRARDKALMRARRAALEAALAQVGGPVDKQARKAVLDATKVWTGAYRVLGETRSGDAIEVEVEVEIDLVRLAKRVAARSTGEGRPLFRLGDVGSADACGDPEAILEAVRGELSAQKAVVLEGEGDGLDVALDCQTLGPVRHTYLHAVRVRVAATAEGQTVVELTRTAFATDAAEAMGIGVQQALGDVAVRVAERRRGRVQLRVRGPMPSALVRRLETALRNSVLGVDAVEVAGVWPSVVELAVRGDLDAKTLARRLDDVSLPGVRLLVVDVEPPDVLTVAFE